MTRTAKWRLCATGFVLGAAATLAGCASDGGSYVGVSYGFGYHWYDDPWYRDDIYIRPPVDRPRPEHPIERPPARPTPLPARPPVRPTPLPARPIPRPMPRGRLR